MSRRAPLVRHLHRFPPWRVRLHTARLRGALPRAVRRPRPRRRGQALVEFLLIIPILLLLLLGTIDVGQILLANYTVTQAARAAAHQAALAGGDDAAANQTASDVIDGGVGTSAADAAVLVACARIPCRRYDPITVSITYVGEFWAPLPGLFERFTVHAAATRAAERDEQ